MLCEPAVRADADRLAVLAVSGTLPRTVIPDLNVTVPVGLPLVVTVTVAVNVTVCPTVEGFRLETTTVLLGYLLTTCFSAVDVLPVLFTSPRYFAVTEWFPDALNEASMLACPFTSVAEPSDRVPDLKSTVPLTMPWCWLVTVAVKVMVCSTNAGFSNEATAVVVLALVTT